MTPQQKAVDLFNDYYSYLKVNLMYDEEAREDAKQCALIAVEEISQHCYQVMKPFWEEVKQEIEKL
jgi:hypothetical protein